MTFNEHWNIFLDNLLYSHISSKTYDKKGKYLIRILSPTNTYIWVVYGWIWVFELMLTTYLLNSMSEFFIIDDHIFGKIYVNN